MSFEIKKVPVSFLFIYLYVLLSESSEMPGRVWSRVPEEEEVGGSDEDCLYCDQTFPGRPDQLAVHLAQHSSCLEAKCGTCGGTFPTDADLQAHSGECEGRQPVSAALRGGGSGAKEEEAAHQSGDRGKVVTVRPHICPVCSKQFKSASRLRVHSGTSTR